MVRPTPDRDGPKATPVAAARTDPGPDGPTAGMALQHLPADQPVVEDGRGKGAFLCQLFRRLSPIEGQPTGHTVGVAGNEPGQPFRRNVQREYLLDHQGPAPVTSCQNLQGLFRTAFVGIQVHANEIEFARDHFGVESRKGVLGLSFREQSHGDEGLRVLVPNGGGHGTNPLAGNGRSWSAGRVQRNGLHVTEPAEFTGQPVALRSGGTGDERLVHEVVTPDGAAIPGRPGDGAPEGGLGLPTTGFIQGIVPGRHGRPAVTTQSG